MVVVVVVVVEVLVVVALRGGSGGEMKAKTQPPAESWRGPSSLRTH
jgi:hypothetical protein